MAPHRPARLLRAARGRCGEGGGGRRFGPPGGSSAAAGSGLKVAGRERAGPERAAGGCWVCNRSGLRGACGRGRWAGTGPIAPGASSSYLAVPGGGPRSLAKSRAVWGREAALRQSAELGARGRAAGEMPCERVTGRWVRRWWAGGWVGDLRSVSNLNAMVWFRAARSCSERGLALCARGFALGGAVLQMRRAAAGQRFGPKSEP